MSLTRDTPYDLVNPPKIKDLLELYQPEVQECLAFAREHVSQRPDLADAAAEAPLDELFVLRHVLSAPKKSIIATVKTNVVKTIEWRALNLKELLEAQADPDTEERRRLYALVQSGHPGDIGGMHPVLAVRVGHAKLGQMAKLYPHEDLVKLFLLGNEYTYHMVDKNTRRLGVLCKCISVSDFAGFSLMNMSRKFSAANGESSHLSSVYYPQHAGKVAFLHTGSILKLLMGMMKSVVSASIMSKVGVCGASSSNKDPRNCPFLAKFAEGPLKIHGAEAVPTYLNGPVHVETLMRAEDKQ